MQKLLFPSVKCLGYEEILTRAETGAKTIGRAEAVKYDPKVER